MEEDSYLEGHGHLVSVLTTPMSHIITQSYIPMQPTYYKECRKYMGSFGAPGEETVQLTSGY